MPRTYGYMDRRLQLREELDAGMRRMSSAQFEDVLHPGQAFPRSPIPPQLQSIAHRRTVLYALQRALDLNSFISQLNAKKFSGQNTKIPTK